MSEFQKYQAGFRNLRVWQESHLLTLMIYRVSSEFPNDERFGITSQIRRSAASIGANIAEGSGRRTSRDQCRFYMIARGSLTETDNFLELAYSLRFIDGETYKKLLEQLNKSGYLLQKLISSFKT